MRSVIALILSLLLLAITFVTGVFLFLWIAIILASVIIYLLIRQKLTGRKPESLFIYRSRQTDQPPIIDAEYWEIDKK